MEMGSVPLGGVEAEVVKQGLGFLFTQATEVLKRRRAARDKAARETGAVEIELPALEPPERVFVPGAASSPGGTAQLAERAAQDLALARHDVEEYVDDLTSADLRSTAAVAAVVRLREVLARLYGTDFRFVGESGPIQPTVSVTDNRNYGVRVDSGGTIRARKVIGSQTSEPG